MDEHKEEPEESKPKWEEGQYYSAAEQELRKKAADKKVFRDIERKDHIKDRKNKKYKLALLTLGMTGGAVLVSYITSGLMPGAMAFSPFVAAIIAYFVGRYEINRIYSTCLFGIPAFMTFPIFFAGLFMIIWGSMVGFMAEDKYSDK